MKPVKFHPEAESEMINSAGYYESQQVDLGKRFLESVQSSLKHIQINPKIYQKVYGNIRRCQIKIFPFGIIFREQKEQIEIIAVMHLKRKPKYWKDRT
ncbi:type II toxin-antitoxin system RelE/ParE family toxin [Spirochaetota bacterium]